MACAARTASRLATIAPDEAEALIADGTIAGGMVPKVRAALGALSSSGAEAIIADASVPGALRRALDDPRLRDARHGRPGGGRMTARGHRAATSRQRAIRELIARVAGEQPGPARRASCAARGIVATQATVSRDMAELGLVKVARGGRHVYLAPEDLAPGAARHQLATSGCAASWPTSP